MASHIKLVPASNGVISTDNGGTERHFASIDELRQELEKAFIDSWKFSYQLRNLSQGLPVALFVSDKEFSAFFR